MKRYLFLVCLLSVCAGLAPAVYAENPLYLTGKVGTTSLNADIGDSFSQILDGEDTSSSFGLGFRLGNYFAFQAEYQDLGVIPGFGSPCADGSDECLALAIPVEADSSAVTVTVLPQLRLTERFSAYAKIGFVSWSSDVSEISDTGERFVDKFDDEDLVAGAGLRYDFIGAFGAFAEYERIADVFDSVSIGATFGF